MYAANDILDDTGITVTSDYLNFFVGTASKTAGYPFTPTTTFTPNGFGGFNETDPAGSWYKVVTNTGGGVDFNLSGNSFEMFSRAVYGSITSVLFSLYNGTATGMSSLWNPCENNTLSLSFDHERTIVVPGGGWGVDTPANEVGGSLRVSESGASGRVVEVAPILDYDRDTGDFSNGFKVTDQAGVETTYNFGTTSTNSASIDIKLIITPVAPTTTSPVKNRWNLEFDVTGGGTSITIPSYEFEIPYGTKFEVDNTISFGCSTGSVADRYKVSDYTIALSDTVIP